MRDTLAPANPWWHSNTIITEEMPISPYDLGHECGHARDRHDSQGKCRIYHHTVEMGGDEGTDPLINGGKQVIIPPTTRERPACACRGEKVWHVCMFPANQTWDTLTDPQIDLDLLEGHCDAQGRYVWWVTKKKKKS